MKFKKQARKGNPYRVTDFEANRVQREAAANKRKARK